MTKMILPGVAVVIVATLAIIFITSRSQPLLNNSSSLVDSISYFRVLQGLGQDVTQEINKEELLSLLTNTRLQRDTTAWTGTLNADWIIKISQTGNRFHRTMTIALGDAHGMMTERGFRSFIFSISNGHEIIEALERMLGDESS